MEYMICSNFYLWIRGFTFRGGALCATAWGRKKYFFSGITRLCANSREITTLLRRVLRKRHKFDYIAEFGKMHSSYKTFDTGYWYRNYFAGTYILRSVYIRLLDFEVVIAKDPTDPDRIRWVPSYRENGVWKPTTFVLLKDIIRVLSNDMDMFTNDLFFDIDPDRQPITLPGNVGV